MGARHAERAAQPSWLASSVGRRLARLQRASSMWRASGVHRRCRPRTGQWLQRAAS